MLIFSSLYQCTCSSAYVLLDNVLIDVLKKIVYNYSNMNFDFLK